jgi:hypothetical protein
MEHFMTFSCHRVLPVPKIVLNVLVHQFVHLALILLMCYPTANVLLAMISVAHHVCLTVKSTIPVIIQYSDPQFAT